MLLPLITIALLFRTFDAIKTFDIVYMVTKGGPGNATTVLSYDIWRKGFVENQLGYAAALSVLAIIMLTVLAQLYFRAIGRQLREVEE
jgi:multiple sugar transport system permease protein